MKKTYIAPETEIVMIETVSVIAESIVFGGEGTVDENGDAAPEFHF